MASIKKSTKHKKNVVRKRQQYSLSLKLHAINMHLDGKSNREIIKHIKEKWNITVSSSTVSTWYTPKSVEKLKKLPEGCITLKQQAIKMHLDGRSNSEIIRHIKEKWNIRVSLSTVSTWYTPASIESGFTDDRVPINCIVCEVSFKEPLELIEHLNVQHVIPKGTSDTTTIATPQPSTSRMGASPMEDISDTSLPSVNNDNDNSYTSLPSVNNDNDNSYALLDDIHYELLDDGASFDADSIDVTTITEAERDSSIDVTTITEADRDDAARAVTPPPPPQREEADVITPPMKPQSPSSRSLTGSPRYSSPMHTDALVTHFRARSPRSIASTYWEGKHADQSSKDLQESSEESMYVPEESDLFFSFASMSCSEGCEPEVGHC